MRLPGTTNFMTDKKLAKGYPPGDRPACIVDWHPERTYSVECFAPAGSRIAVDHDSIVVAGAEGIESLARLDDYGVPAWAKLNIEYGQDVERLHGEHAKVGHRIDQGPYPGKRSEARYAALTQLARNGVPAEIALGLLKDTRFGISAAVLERRDADRYALKEVEDAVRSRGGRAKAGKRACS